MLVLFFLVSAIRFVQLNAFTFYRPSGRPILLRMSAGEEGISPYTYQLTFISEDANGGNDEPVYTKFELAELETKHAKIAAAACSSEFATICVHATATGEQIGKIGFTPTPGVASALIDDVMKGAFGEIGGTAILRYITIPDLSNRGLGLSQQMLRYMEKVWKFAEVDFGLLVVIGKDDRGGGLKKFWMQEGWTIVDDSQRYRDFFGIDNGDHILVKQMGEIM